MQEQKWTSLTITSYNSAKWQYRTVTIKTQQRSHPYQAAYKIWLKSNKNQGSNCVFFKQNTSLIRENYSNNKKNNYFAWYKRYFFVPVGLRPPKMIALIGTPLGSSHLGWIIGHWPAGQVKRALGWAAFPGCPILQLSPSQVVMEMF